MSIDNESRIKRLLYRSWYRGCKETDRILGEFAKRELRSFSESQIDEFEALIEEDDNDIYAWIAGRKEIPERMKNNSVFNKLLETPYQRS